MLKNVKRRTPALIIGILIISLSVKYYNSVQTIKIKDSELEKEKKINSDNGKKIKNLEESVKKIEDLIIEKDKTIEELDEKVENLEDENNRIKSENNKLKKEIKQNNTTTRGVSKTVSGSSNSHVAWNFFKSKGFSNNATAGILGNLEQESKMNPRNKSSSGKYVGLAQWDVGGRWDNLVAWANNSGKDPWNLYTQLEFIYKEMTDSSNYGTVLLNKWYGGLNGYNSISSADQATVAFEKCYERAGTKALHKRKQFAREYLNKYGN